MRAMIYGAIIAIAVVITLGLMGVFSRRTVSKDAYGTVITQP